MDTSPQVVTVRCFNNAADKNKVADKDNELKIVSGESSVIIGRGNFGITDKRASRKQVQHN